jgi:hypothetical protein
MFPKYLLKLGNCMKVKMNFIPLHIANHLKLTWFGILLHYFLHLHSTHILLIREMVVESCNRRFGCETIHSTQKFTSMNLLQMPCVITSAQKKFSLQPKKIMRLREILVIYNSYHSITSLFNTSRFWKAKFQAWRCQKGSNATKTWQEIGWNAREPNKKTAQEKVK